MKTKTEILIELRKMNREFIQLFVCMLANDPLNEVELDKDFEHIDEMLEDLKRVDFALLREAYESTMDQFEEVDCDNEEDFEEAEDC